MRHGNTVRYHHTIISTLACAFLIVPFSCASAATDSALAPQASKTAKIMPLGDSITESSAGLPSYRFYLWQLVQTNGYRIDLVGSKQGTANGPPANQNFDMDHEGHSGWRADEALAQISDWATAASPDFVLLHLGHNDLCQGQDVIGTVRDLGGIIDVLRTVNPRIGVLVAQIIASSEPCHAQIPALNAQLPALVAAKHTQESPVMLVDQYTGFLPATMTRDGVHPNATGESHMADRWFVALAPLLDGFFSAAP